MTTMLVSYLGSLRTEAKHVSSGAGLITDAPLDNQGKGESFSPTDLLSVSLGSCMFTIMGIAARTHQIKLEGATVKVTKIMVSDPRRVSEIHLDFDFPGLSFDEHQKVILERAARTCPVALSIHPDIKQIIQFNW